MAMLNIGQVGGCWTFPSRNDASFSVNEAVAAAAARLSLN